MAVPLVAMVFAPALNNGFVSWDDQVNFLENEAYRGVGWPQFVWAFRTFHLGVYQPVAWLLLSVESSIWGLDPRGYHLTSVLLHSLNLVICAVLTAAVLIKCRPATPQGHDPAFFASCATAAAVLALHPLCVEPVAWASGQPYLSCSLFAMLSVLAYLRAGGPLAAPARLARGFTGAVRPVTAFQGGGRRAPRGIADSRHLSPAADRVGPLVRFRGTAGLPGEAAVLRPHWRRHVPRHSGPARLESVAFGVVDPDRAGGTHRLCGRLLSRQGAGPDGDLEHLRGERPHRAGGTIGGSRPRAGSGPHGGLVRAPAAHPWMLAIWACYLAILAPVSGLLASGGRTLVADRYAYLSLACFAPLAATLLWEAVRGERRHRSLFVAAIAVVSVVLTVETVRTRSLCRVWHDSESLWSHAYSHGYDRSPLVLNNLGLVYAERSELDRALGLFEAAVQVEPADPASLNNLGYTLVLKGRYEEAIGHLTEALRQNPGDPEAHHSMGVAQARLGRTDAAAEHFRETLRIKPDHADARQELEQLESDH